MSRMRKIYKKYERWVLLALVILLLATFSITGAASCEGQGERGSWHLGGSYLVAPSERAELSDEEYDRMFARWANFQRALRMPTREFRNYVMGLQPDDTFKAAWAHHLAYSAGEAAGYRAGERQITTAVEDLVGFALMFRSRLPFSDVNYQQFLADNYEGSQADFREGVRQIVVKDQFLYPIVNAARTTRTATLSSPTRRSGSSRQAGRSKPASNASRASLDSSRAKSVAANWLRTAVAPPCGNCSARRSRSTWLSSAAISSINWSVAP